MFKNCVKFNRYISNSFYPNHRSELRYKKYNIGHIKRSIDLTYDDYERLANVNKNIDLNSFKVELIINYQPWKTNNVKNMKEIFYGASEFNNGEDKIYGNTNALKWNVDHVTDMSYMFYNASNFNREIWTLDVFGKVIRQYDNFDTAFIKFPTFII